MPPKNITVRAVAGRALPVPGHPGRHVGRDPADAIIAAGVAVPAESYYLRAVARGDLERVPEATP